MGTLETGSELEAAMGGRHGGVRGREPALWWEGGGEMVHYLPVGAPEVGRGHCGGG